MTSSNLTVLTGATVRRLAFEGRNATAVEVEIDGQVRRFRSGSHIVLSLGAVHTPKVLMQSGLGPARELRRWNLSVIQDLPGVGEGFQDHPGVPCIWESAQPIISSGNAGHGTLFSKSQPDLQSPDLQMFISEAPRASPENTKRFPIPQHAWMITACLVRTQSRGRIQLTGPDPGDPVRIDAAHLSQPDDVRALIRGVQLARELGHSTAFAIWRKREVMPINLGGQELERFVRDGAMTLWHSSGTAKMGTDAMSVVDGRLRVHGVDGLTVADASIMPRVTTGNTMAPCVVIGERASDDLVASYRL